MDTKPIPVADPAGGANLRDGAAPPPRPRGKRTIRDRILGGLILALPLLLTILIIAWLYSILEPLVLGPLTRFVLWKLQWTTSMEEVPYWFKAYLAPALSVLLALVLLYCLDLLADTALRRGVDWTLKRVPVFSLIYNPVQQIFEALEQQPQQQGRQRMVLVTFPHPGIKLPAFVTATCQDVETRKTLLCVYVPTTPIPTNGFFLIVPEEEVTELNWDTEQTLQAVISGGLASPREVTFYKPKAPAAPAPVGAASPE
jgi:uncharacterized membrane protein